MGSVRVRYAPSPTGHLHIGNARTALFNYLFARKHGGSFVIRIEDTDAKRNVAGGEESQLRFMKWLGLDWDEGVDVGGPYGPYRQSERLDIYRQFTEQLLAAGLAYKCYCTEEELEAERAEQMEKGENPRYSGKHRHLSAEEAAQFEREGRQASIRFAVPADREYVFEDMVKGEVRFQSSDFGDFVIVKKDGVPTYNFAVAVDDHLMGITHVLRGDDHITNTPRQMMIYEALGWQTPQFAHMTLIVNEQRKKLSKRDESIVQFIEQYRDLGYLPETLFNYIALLGWSPPGEEEIFSREQLIELFDTDRLSKSPAVFDTQKLAWLNNHYLKQADLADLLQLALPYFREAGYLSQEEVSMEQLAWLERLVALYQEQLTCVADITTLSQGFFSQSVTYEPEALEVLANEAVPPVLDSFGRLLGEAESLTADTCKALIKQVQKETGQKGKGLFMPIRAAVTGQVHGRDLNETLSLLGKEKLLQRLSERSWVQ